MKAARTVLIGELGVEVIGCEIAEASGSVSLFFYERRDVYRVRGR
jgi:hypothetical protein